MTRVQNAKDSNNSLPKSCYTSRVLAPAASHKAKKARTAFTITELLLYIWLFLLQLSGASSAGIIFKGWGLLSLYLFGLGMIDEYLKKDRNCFPPTLRFTLHVLFLINYGYCMFKKNNVTILIPALICLLTTIFVAFLPVKKAKRHGIRKTASLLLVSCLITTAIPIVKTELYYTGDLLLMFKDYIVTGNPQASVHLEEIKPPKDFNDLRNWNELNQREKTNLLRVVEEFECADLGISYRPKLVICELPSKQDVYKTRGAFIESKKTIQLDEDLLSSVEDSLRTLFHEVHHAYIYDLIDHVDFTQDYVRTSAYFRELAVLQQNTRQYHTLKDGFGLYADQPLEIAAREYSEKRYADLYEQYVS